MILSSGPNHDVLDTPLAMKFTDLGASMDPVAMQDRWRSVDEVAVYLGVKRDTLYKANLPVNRAPL